MEKNKISWNAKRRRRASETYHVVIPRDDRKVFCLLGEPVEVELHRVAGRTLPHLVDGCPHCKGGACSAFPYGYAPAVTPAVTESGAATWKTVILGIPGNSLAELDQLVKLANGNYRLMQIVAWAEKSGTRASHIELRKILEREPPFRAFDVRPTLYHMWGIKAELPENPDENPTNSEESCNEPLSVKEEEASEKPNAI